MSDTWEIDRPLHRRSVLLGGTATAERPELTTVEPEQPEPQLTAEMRLLIDELAELLPGARCYLDFVRAFPQSTASLANGKQSVQRAERAALRLQALIERVTG